MFRLNEYYKDQFGGGDCKEAYDQQRTVKTLGQCSGMCRLGENCNRFTWGDPEKVIGPTGKKGAGCRISNSKR